MASQSQKQQSIAPRLDERLYNNAEVSNAIIVFGPEGEERFEAHRLVLCNSIEWFNRAFQNFAEADSREIILHGDDPEAVRSMLKWAYTGQYAEAVEHPISLSEAKKLFLQHLCVFVVADKYVAKGLEQLAFDHLEDLMDSYISKPVDGRPETHASSFMRFAIEEVFVHQTCFPYLDSTLQHSDKHEQDDSMSDEVVYSTESDEDFFKHHEGGNSDHPVDRMQALLVKKCMNVWRVNDNAEFNKKHLQTLVCKVEGFGSLMSYQFLKSIVPKEQQLGESQGSRWIARAIRI
ncbi:hypothetical protein DE146DRAFT_784980 [Phaeosphaeria sp. MPI-PUGE-AT-0046c]|nr:hypothetical protein DE146DRAFT_784980 [Phaeosphaeria sp. MPI-PUGE-AT-0046c]